MSKDLFLQQFEALAEGIEKAAEQALVAVAQIGLRSLQSTSRFNDITGTLRASFQVSGEGFERLLEVNPSVTSSSGRTPPNMYARFLENGTKFIEARPFFGDARTQLEQLGHQVFERELQRHLR